MTEQILADLDFIAKHWGDLREMRRPGTSRPWRQALLDPDRRAAMLARDREERAERDPDAPGFTSAPEHIDVLDVMVEIWTTLDEFTEAISPDWRKTNLGGNVRQLMVIDPMLNFVVTWVTEAAEAQPQIIARFGKRLQLLVVEMQRTLGLVVGGQMLNGAVCPWCRGVTPQHPAGGAITMRIEEITTSQTVAFSSAMAVVCWNPSCEPPDADYSIRFRGRPGWPQHDWEWLTPRLLVAEPRVSVPRPPTTFTQLLPDGTTVEIVPIDHSVRPAVHTMPCVKCAYVENVWHATDHEPFDPCPVPGCGSNHWCVHRAHPDRSST